MTTYATIDTIGAPGDKMPRERERSFFPQRKGLKKDKITIKMFKSPLGWQRPQVQVLSLRPEKAEQTLCLFCFFLFEFHDDELRKRGTHLLVLRSAKLWIIDNYRRKTKFVRLSLRPKIRSNCTNSCGFFLLIFGTFNNFALLCAICFFPGTYQVHTLDMYTVCINLSSTPQKSL